MTQLQEFRVSVGFCDITAKITGVQLKKLFYLLGHSSIGQKPRGQNAILENSFMQDHAKVRELKFLQCFLLVCAAENRETFIPKPLQLQMKTCNFILNQLHQIQLKKKNDQKPTCMGCYGKKRKQQMMKMKCSKRKDDTRGFLLQPCSCQSFIQIEHIHANQLRKSMLELLSNKTSKAWNRNGRKQQEKAVSFWFSKTEMHFPVNTQTRFKHSRLKYANPSSPIQTEKN